MKRDGLENNMKNKLDSWNPELDSDRLFADFQNRRKKRRGGVWTWIFIGLGVLMLAALINVENVDDVVDRVNSVDIDNRNDDIDEINGSVRGKVNPAPSINPINPNSKDGEEENVGNVDNTDKPIVASQHPSSWHQNDRDNRINSDDGLKSEVLRDNPTSSSNIEFNVLAREVEVVDYKEPITSSHSIGSGPITDIKIIKLNPKPIKPVLKLETGIRKYISESYDNLIVASQHPSSRHPNDRINGVDIDDDDNKQEEGLVKDNLIAESHHPSSHHHSSWFGISALYGYHQLNFGGAPEWVDIQKATTQIDGRQIGNSGIAQIEIVQSDGLRRNAEHELIDVHSLVIKSSLEGRTCDNPQP